MSNDNGTSKALTTTADQPRQLAQFGELSVAGIVARKEKILEVMRSVMREGQHYGKIPGCGDKPTLHKAGAEILATTFALAPKFKIARTDHPGGHREYEIVCTMVHIPSGLELGEGVGMCSTMESKYRWRKGGRSCPECGSSTALLKSKDKPEWFCWRKKDGCGAVFPLADERIASQNVDRVENPDIYDQMNTVLKMAKKRAQVDATLTATGASDLLTQDLEDIRGVADDFRGSDVDDAEFTDYGGGYGNAPRGPDANRGDNRERNGAQYGDDPPRGERNGNAQRRSNGPDLEAIALDLIADLNKARTPDEVQKLAPRFSALPKGTPARKSAYDVFNRRLTDTKVA